MFTFNNERNGIETRRPNKRLTAALIATLSATALAGCASPNEEPPAPEVTVSATPETPPLLEGEELIQHFEIPAELQGVELAQAFVDRESEWTMYGVKPDLASEASSILINSDYAHYEQYFIDIANKNSLYIPKALFTDNALTQEHTKNYVTNMTEKNANSLEFYDKTSPESQNPYNFEPYNRQATLAEFESSTVNEDGSETVVFTAKTKINYDKNVSDDLALNGPLGDELREYTVTFVQEGDTDKIDSINVHVF